MKVRIEKPLDTYVVVFPLNDDNNREGRINCRESRDLALQLATTLQHTDFAFTYPKTHDDVVAEFQSAQPPRFDLVPTWAEMVPLFIDIASHPEAPEYHRTIATKWLQKCAMVADLYTKSIEEPA